MTGNKPFRLGEVWAKLAVARQSVMIEDQAKQLNRSHAVVNAHDKKYGGSDYTAPEDPVIVIGDVNNEAPAAAPQTAKRGMSPLVSGLIGAGLLATGLGAGVGGWMIADAIRNIKPASTVVAPVTPGDGNTKYQLKLLP